jgi:HD superfamily phosphohydrolase YqeK
VAKPEKGIYREIEAQAKPYLDTRCNEIHVSVCYAMAERLLSLYPEADPEVVLPAILLHDVGWKMVPEEKQLTAFGPRANDTETRRVHEIEGVAIARRILASLDYERGKTEEILSIIEGHDSREEALSLNDAIVKDADKLWRFSQVGLETDLKRFDVDRAGYVRWLKKRVRGWLFTAAARELAYRGLADAGAPTVDETDDVDLPGDERGLPRND